LAVVAVLSLALGAAWGWWSRPADLLAETAPPPATAPAVWMAPGWSAIAKRSRPADQYRAAQLGAAWDDRTAAWLAVPGHFPAARDWSSRAYIQLARHLFRGRDAERLQALAVEIGRWPAAQTHEKQLAAIVQAAVEALEGDLAGVIEQFDKHLDLPSVIDPALLELSLEITTRAARSAAADGDASVPSGLQDIQRKLIAKLLTPAAPAARQGPLNPSRTDPRSSPVAPPR
jgi:serine/threonine-protein kinase